MEYTPSEEMPTEKTPMEKSIELSILRNTNYMGTSTPRDVHKVRSNDKYLYKYINMYICIYILCILCYS